MRLRNNPNADKELIDSGILINDFPHFTPKNSVIELGMGKGEMITKLAFKNTDINFIGIEKYPTVAAKAAKKANLLKLNNFKIICEDIKKLSELLSGKVKIIWLTFSDPWPKARHEKRRLTHKTFLELYKKILDIDGVIKFKTDNDKLFEYSIEHMKENNMKLFNITRDFHSSEFSKDNIMTGYEKKWSEKGKKINYLEAKF